MANISLPKDLNYAEELINEGKIKEALKIITRFEQNALTYSLKGDIDKVLEIYLKCKEFYEKIG